jgi:hypothetical protein
MEGCVVTELKVHSQQHCCLLSSEQMKMIEETSASTTLERGTNIVERVCLITVQGQGIPVNPLSYCGSMVGR